MKSKASPVKAKILSTASRLFYTQGYNSTGINQVIEESDIARATLYKHFPSKNDLLSAYLDERNERWFENLELFLAGFKSAEEKILGIFDYRIERQTAQQFGGCPFVKVSAEISPEEKTVFDTINNHKTHLVDLLKELVAQLEHKSKISDTEELADTIYFLMEGAVVDVSIKKNITPLHKAKNITKQLIGA